VALLEHGQSIGNLPSGADQLASAPELAERLLAPLGRRWDHTVGVARRARIVAPLLDEPDAHALIAAAYLHDIGYAPDLIETGFHPLDGARFLRRHGEARLATLVAHHTGAHVEAQELGLERELSEFPEERSPVAKLLTYADLTTSRTGAAVPAKDRLADIVSRYGDTPPARAARRSAPALLTLVDEVERLLRLG